MLVTSAALAGCYSGAAATRDVDRAWVGRQRAEIIARWGPPAANGVVNGLAVMQWSHTNTQITLPSAAAALHVEPGHVEAAAAFQPGEVWHTTTEAAAIADPAGTIVGVEGASVRWGPPNDANLHWSGILGAHVGLGRLDTTPTPLPSGGVYIGGMLGPTLGLVGAFSLVAGTSTAGGAMGMSGGVCAQWWPVNRLWLRGGPAMMLTFDPGFQHAALRPGIASGASYAIVKVGTFVLDLRFDLTAGASVVFGSIGVGVGMN
jgi:hypothetical protein